MHYLRNSLMLLAVLLCASAGAGWFVDDGSYQTRREEKVAVLSPPRLDALRALIAERDARQAEVAVLGRLAAEKGAAVEAFTARFASEYGIRPDRNYTFDPAEQTIYLLTTDERHGGTPEAPARLPHRVFPTEEEAREFLSLMQAKDAALAAQRLFLETEAEKKTALADVTARMGRDFRLDPKRSYRLDSVVRSVYAQYVPPPPPRVKTPEEIAAEKDAQAAEARREREEAKARGAALREEAKRLAAERASLSEEQKESIKVREDALRKVEKELAELDAKEKARQKAEAKAREALAREQAKAAQAKAEAEAKAAKEKARVEKARAEAKAAEERRKAEAEAKAAKEKARADKVAAEKKAEEERRKAKLAEEKARAESEAKKKAEKEAMAKLSEEERAEAVSREKAAIAERVNALRTERDAARVRAATDLSAAERAEMALVYGIRNVEAQLRNASSDEKLTDWRRTENARLAAMKQELAEAKKKTRLAREAVAAAEKSLSRAEKDATQAFYDELRAQGKTPLTESRGPFSWF